MTAVLTTTSSTVLHSDTTQRTPQAHVAGPIPDMPTSVNRRIFLAPSCQAATANEHSRSAQHRFRAEDSRSGPSVGRLSRRNNTQQRDTTLTNNESRSLVSTAVAVMIRRSAPCPSPVPSYPYRPMTLTVYFCLFTVRSLRSRLREPGRGRGGLRSTFASRVAAFAVANVRPQRCS